MELIVIGSGTCVFQKDRGAPGYVLRIGEDLILLDGGTGTLRRCLDVGVDYREIDKIFYTHLHPDHVMDLVPFLFASKYTPGFTRRDGLEIYGPAGFGEFYANLMDLFGKSMVQVEYEISIKELGEMAVHFSQWSVTIRLMQHSPNAIGYRFEQDGKAFVYSGDTDYCESVIELAQGARVLLLECSFPDRLKVPGHLTPTLAGKIANKAGVDKLVLTHFYPPCDQEDILQPCRLHFHGHIVKAEDFMRIVI